MTRRQYLIELVKASATFRVIREAFTNSLKKDYPGFTLNKDLSIEFPKDYKSHLGPLNERELQILSDSMRLQKAVNRALNRVFPGIFHSWDDGLVRHDIFIHPNISLRDKVLPSSSAHGDKLQKAYEWLKAYGKYSESIKGVACKDKYVLWGEKFYENPFYYEPPFSHPKMFIAIYPDTTKDSIDWKKVDELKHWVYGKGKRIRKIDDTKIYRENISIFRQGEHYRSQDKRIDWGVLPLQFKITQTACLKRYKNLYELVYGRPYSRRNRKLSKGATLSKICDDCPKRRECEKRPYLYVECPRVEQYLPKIKPIAYLQPEEGEGLLQRRKMGKTWKNKKQSRAD